QRAEGGAVGLPGAEGGDGADEFRRRPAGGGVRLGAVRLPDCRGGHHKAPSASEGLQTFSYTSPGGGAQTMNPRAGAGRPPADPGSGMAPPLVRSSPGIVTARRDGGRGGEPPLTTPHSPRRAA